MTYEVPGGSAGRHIVFDAPEASDGTSAVTATANGTACDVSITAGSGGGFTGHPLMFQIAAASGSCTPSDSTTVSPGSPPPGGGIDAGPPSQGGSGSGGGSGGGTTDQADVGAQRAAGQAGQDEKPGRHPSRNSK